MIEKTEFDFNNFNEICNTLNTITNIDIQLFDADGNPIFQLVEHNLPVKLQILQNYNIHICNFLRNNALNSYYHYINSYGLEYISCGIWNNGSFHGAVSVGPFISFIPTIESVSDIISINKFPISEREHLHELYKSLSVLSIKHYSSIGNLIVNLCSHSYVYPTLLTCDTIKPEISKNDLITNIAETKNIIEIRYEYERRITNAIKNGDKDEVSNILKQSNIWYDFTYRIPKEPIRSTKNVTFAFNTILRTAAQGGGVHPIYIHNISEKFAIMIEKAPNLPYLQKLMFIMINEYCDLVKKFSTNNYSPIVKSAVDYINLNIEDKLTLKSIANEIHVNSSHLSRKFKCDTNMTIIDYINRKRIEEAKLYLERGNVSFAEIALMVGFTDLNYFGRVFKKITSLTPSEYVKSNKLLNSSTLI